MLKDSYKNIEMLQMLNSLKPLLEYTSTIGYAAARNTRLLENTLTEYTAKNNEAVQKFGEKEIDENGNETGNLKIGPGSEHWKEFCEFMNPYHMIEHEAPNLMILKFDDVKDELTGKEILSIDWMLED